ncbi:hypothetical protein BKA66DRAFT_553743 [Pyrenochaeta sp. MPI-SDFR-AT-0127]|nr:hypothetical protein BKA66DRAFT_553743 [Pyrenochaeta sp. MPI-SDFR-AT-0127]
MEQYARLPRRRGEWRGPAGSGGSIAKRGAQARSAARAAARRGGRASRKWQQQQEDASGRVDDGRVSSSKGWLQRATLGESLDGLDLSKSGHVAANGRGGRERLKSDHGRGSLHGAECRVQGAKESGLGWRRGSILLGDPWLVQRSARPTQSRGCPFSGVLDGLRDVQRRSHAPAINDMRHAPWTPGCRTRPGYHAAVGDGGRGGSGGRGGRVVERWWWVRQLHRPDRQAHHNPSRKVTLDATRRDSTRLNSTHAAQEGESRQACGTNSYWFSFFCYYYYYSSSPLFHSLRR